MNKFRIGNKGLYVFLLCFYFQITFASGDTKQETRSKNAISHQLLAIPQSSITGTVKDVQGVMPGVTVSVQGKSVSTISDENGQFSIAASEGDVLVFAYVGYATYSWKVTTAITVDVVLQEDATALQEVTVNAGYYTVKDKERTGSIAKITAKDIENQPVTNVLAAMQGRMAGVNITQTTGTPGGGFEVQIRGQNSLRLNGNAPLYVIDGVPYSADPIGIGVNSAVLPTQPNPLNSINPDQIASIEVLKDADATAIYGSRGANGVVLITTKKGTVGKTSYQVRATSGVASVAQRLDLLSTEDYLTMRREAYANDGITTLPATANDVNGTWMADKHTDWQDVLLGSDAQLTDVNASVSGGSKQTQFLLSGNYNLQESVLPKSFAYQKGNVLVNVNHLSEDERFSATFSMNHTIQDNEQPRLEVLREVIALAPNAPDLYTETGGINWENNTFNNPLRNFEGRYSAKTTDWIASGVLRYRLAKGLQLQSGFGFTQLFHKERTPSPHTSMNPAQGATSASSTLFASQHERKSWQFEPQVNYTLSFGKHTLDALAGAAFQSQSSTQLVQMGIGFASNSLLGNLASASTLLTMNNASTEYRYQAFYGRLNYQWDERYIVNFTGRRDGSSRFGTGNQFAYFGAVGGAWLFSRESFLKNSKVLSFGKLRGSYGLTGSDQIGDYQYLNTYSSGSNYGGVVGLQPTALFNPSFAWERNRKVEVALETGFLKDRLFLTAAWYAHRSSNQLTGIPLPGTTGFTSLTSNFDATVANKGLELTFRVVPFQGKDFSWVSQLNYTQNRNTLVSYRDLATSSYANQLVIGQPLGIVKLYHYTGVDPQTGLYTFEDVNGDGSYNAANDKKRFMDVTPDFYGGWQNTFTYKRWRFDLLFQFVKQDNFAPTVYFGAPGTFANQLESVMDRWQQPGDIANHQRFTSGANSAATAAYSRYLESDAMIADASFVRLKNFSLSYDLPLSKLACRLFFEGQNVLTFTGYKGLDPEFRSAGYLPPLRVLTLGAQLRF